MTIDCYCALGVDREFNLTADALLAALDQAGVDRAIIAPTDRQLAIQNREGNNELLAAFQTHQNFIAACTANPWYGNEAVWELQRAIAEGARMIVLHPFVQGFVADDELVWPLLEVAADQRVPVYFHTGPHGSATPFQVMGLARRFPTVDFIIGHSGATDFWYDAGAAVADLDNCWLEASLAKPFNFSRYIDQLGAAKGIMGSFAPINDFVFEWEQMRKVLSGPKYEAIYGANLLRLLKKRGPL